jgi:hypothetical protein
MKIVCTFVVDHFEEIIFPEMEMTFELYEKIRVQTDTHQIMIRREH